MTPSRHHPPRLPQDSSTSDDLMDDSSSYGCALESPPRPNRTPKRCRLFDDQDMTSPSSNSSRKRLPQDSPYSYVTMDGRFVQSKNPFSSPMVVNANKNEDSDANHNLSSAPALPVSLNNANKVLPPRSQNASFWPTTTFQPPSPIPEDAEINTGALHKVRRCQREEDVVAAQFRRPPPVITSEINHPNDSRISPTEVANFPPPTPMKAARPTPPKPFERNIDTNNSNNVQSRLYSDFDIIDQLGKGSFGTVYKVLSRLDGCMYAIKTAQRPARGAMEREKMLQEVYALAALSDQADTATFHIVRYHQAWMEDDRLYIQTELCNGNLYKEMKQQRLYANRVYKLLREMCLALAFLHRNGMVHLDIKPENIFVKNDQFKLGDFGLVTQTSTHRDVEEGDSRYMSLELLAGDHDDLTKSDIFSLGATVYEVCLGRGLPTNGPEWHDIRAGKFSPLPGTDHELIDLIRDMVQPNYRTRPPAAELLQREPLLSDEEKALRAETAKRQCLEWNLMVPKSKKLQRANTWNGSSF